MPQTDEHNTAVPESKEQVRPPTSPGPTPRMVTEGTGGGGFPKVLGRIQEEDFD